MSIRMLAGSLLVGAVETFSDLLKANQADELIATGAHGSADFEPEHRPRVVSVEHGLSLDGE
jgi:hypothetical protein